MFCSDFIVIVSHIFLQQLESMKDKTSVFENVSLPTTWLLISVVYCLWSLVWMFQVKKVTSSEFDRMKHHCVTLCDSKSGIGITESLKNATNCQDTASTKVSTDVSLLDSRGWR